MRRFLSASLVATLFAITLSGSAMAQQLTTFENREALTEQISGYMAKGQFSKLVEAVAPPNLMSVSRIRILEEAYAGELPSLNQVVPLFKSESAGGISRQVDAWWAGDFYVFLGLLVHEREDNLVVLDFSMTSDVRRASRWYLTGSAK